MIKNKMILTKKMKKASWAWDEVGKWVFFLILLVAIVFILFIMFGGVQGVWEKIKDALFIGAG